VLDRAGGITWRWEGALPRGLLLSIVAPAPPRS